MPYSLCVFYEHETKKTAALAFAHALSVPCVAGVPEAKPEPKEYAEEPAQHGSAEPAAEFAVHFTEQCCYLSWPDGKKRLTLDVDFVTGEKAHRRKFGGGKSQAVAKAVGVQAKFKPRVLDCTAGQGGDAFVLASLGCEVTMLERNPVAHVLLDDALQRALDCEDNETSEIAQRMQLRACSAAAFLDDTQQTVFDVVYLDPMFPARKKSAQVKKQMKVFHTVVGDDADADALLPIALQLARYRVVVKRPKGAPYLNGQKPSVQLDGKSTRFDIYPIKALPK